MNTIIKELLFDKELVNRIREEHLSKDLLYKYLTNGQITLREYLASL